MKKQLLSLALAALLTPAFNANAEVVLTEVWRVFSDQINASFDFDAPNWNSETEIKKESCARMATGRDGKMYTINMKTMSIMEITADGFVDKYKLPKLEGNDIYGTAISVDQVGNFLIGHNFTKEAESATVWTVYNPNDGKYSHHDLGNPGADMTDGGLTTNTGVGRTDCVGRVVGDLTNDAIFFIAPRGNPNAYVTRYAWVYNEGDPGDASSACLDGTEWSPGHYLGSSQPQNISQPLWSDYYDYTPENTVDGFITASSEGGQWDIWMHFVDGKAKDDLTGLLRGKSFAKSKGFDTFVLDGKRYYVMNYLATKEDAATGAYTMNIAVFDSKGYVVADWKNDTYTMSGSATGGYSSIVAEPIEDGSVNIYVYNCNTVAAAAMLNFSVKKDEVAVGTIDNPVKIKTATDLVNMGRYFEEGDIYINLENDIDMAGVNYKVPNMDEAFNKIVHFDGQSHVISNLTIKAGNASLLGNFAGEVKNLGLENVDLCMNWYCVGGIAGMASNATISNSYVTGVIRGAASGGIVGRTRGPVKIENCYVSVDVADEVGGESGGLIGRADDKTTIEISNCYASGSVSALRNAGGIASVLGEDKPQVTLNNVISWASSVDAADKDGNLQRAHAIIAGASAVMTNVQVFNEMTVNGQAVSDGVSADELKKTATSWPAFSNELVEDMPVLAWQNGETGGINDIEIEDADSDAAPVYYNLQGVQVANPDNGIYIVRRGSKVNKVYIRK